MGDFGELEEIVEKEEISNVLYYFCLSLLKVAQSYTDLGSTSNRILKYLLEKDWEQRMKPIEAARIKRLIQV